VATKPESSALGSPTVENGEFMKKVSEALPKPATEEDDDLLPEYDFTGGVRGKYAHRLQEGDEFFVNDVLHVKGAGRAHVRVDTTNPALFAAKLALANRLYALTAENRWSLTQLAAALQTSRRKAREFIFGELGRISVDQLVSWLKNVGFDTRINVGVTQQKAPRAKSLRKAGKRTKRSDAPARSAIA